MTKGVRARLVLSRDPKLSGSDLNLCEEMIDLPHVAAEVLQPGEEISGDLLRDRGVPSHDKCQSLPMECDGPDAILCLDRQGVNRINKHSQLTDKHPWPYLVCGGWRTWKVETPCGAGHDHISPIPRLVLCNQ